MLAENTYSEQLNSYRRSSMALNKETGTTIAATNPQTMTDTVRHSTLRLNHVRKRLTILTHTQFPPSLEILEALGHAWLY